MKTFIIAEIGINHNGNIDIVKKLIDVAKTAGCDAVKFQKRTVDEVYSKEYLDSYRESPWGVTQREQKNGLELSDEEYHIINEYCKEKNIEWFASAWDIKSQLFLRQFDLKYNKIASAMLTNKELLEKVAEEKKYTFISTGMSTMEEIAAAVEVFVEHNCPFELMHCNSTYPMNEEDANLNIIPRLRCNYNCNVGYSGHETNNLVSVCAVALGATSIERHITLDKSMYGSDQSASIEPEELFQLVKLIHRTEQIVGDGIKRLSETELVVKEKLRG